MQLHRFERLTSTNSYCEVLDLTSVEDFTCIWALEQTAGKGQRGNTWHSLPNQNLTFSLVLKPDALLAAKQFSLTELLSMSLTDYLTEALPNCKPQVKWPNDIYIGRKKICGILVSNHLQGSNVFASICGIGLNVNQTQFPSSVPNPTSMALLAGHSFVLEDELMRLLHIIECRYRRMMGGECFRNEYLQNMFLYGEEARFLYASEVVDATIQGVDEYGRLLLKLQHGGTVACQMKEVAFL